ncbi:MAG TPA: ATP-binding protein [Gemmatimonadaceae bacterium]|nr:ATP-binding protein [Gemmatimonadaceae bacterium]
MTSRRRALTWLLWIGLLAATTAFMIVAGGETSRGEFTQVHVVLVYLLVVLFGSATGGRTLGVSLALAGVLLIDFYFQPPFGEIGVGKPLDWVALVAFLVTAVVSTQLLARAQAQAEEARRRAVEVASLAQLGSETLSAGRAEDALAKVAEVIRQTLEMDACDIVAWDAESGFRRGRARELAASEPLLQAVAEMGTISWARADGEIIRARASTPDDPQPPASERITRLLLPLSVQKRVVGVLRLAANQPVQLGPAKRRFLDAILYYAALAVDRVRLVAEAEHAEALREADRLKDIVLASVSHDLRTPLTTIKALAQSTAMQGNPAAAAIEEQADRLTRLVSDLLDLSRLKGGGFAVTPELNTAEDLIGAAVRQTRGLFGERPLRTVIDLDSPALVGQFDFSQSLRVLANLLENAVRYSPPGAPIELGATRDGDRLVFTVADRGPGIRAEDAARIFEPFYRAADAVPDTGRAGLGLSIARTLAELQGGTLTHAARPGGGTVFALSLPATEVPVDEVESPA